MLYNLASEARSIDMVRYIPKNTREQKILAENSLTVFVFEKKQHEALGKDLITFFSQPNF